MKNTLNTEKIKAALGKLGTVADLYVFDSIDSTNSYAKNYAKSTESKMPVIFVAAEQSAGRGTRGRSFISRNGAGLYMSILFYPEKGITPADVTVYCAVKACEGIDSLCSLRPGIKWVNDLYVNGKKLSGILTEGSLDENGLAYAVCGIGINTHGTELPTEIADIATSIEKECGEDVSREELCARIASGFLNSAHEIGSRRVIEEYRARSVLIGREVTVSHADGTQFSAKVLEILDTGALLVEDEYKKRHELQSADVSLKIHK